MVNLFQEVERYRSNLADLPTCANNCTLREWQKKLMFVGDLPPETGGNSILPFLLPETF